MTVNRLVLVLLVVTLGFQVAIFFRQQRGGATPRREAPVRDAPKGTTVSVEGMPIKGEGAKVIMVEFSDYECPYCARYATSVEKQIDEQYVKTGKIRYAFANNPLPMHPAAPMLARAALCVPSKDQYWGMHDALFREKPKTEDAVLGLLAPLGVSKDPFVSCLKSTDAARMAQIDRDMAAAKKLGMNGTPGFVVGWADDAGNIKVAKLITGAQPLSVFQEVLNKVLQEPATVN